MTTEQYPGHVLPGSTRWSAVFSMVRRSLKNEKVFLIFETLTRRISKGKAATMPNP